MTIKALDYTQLSTWESLDSMQTCLRIGESNAGALVASMTIYKGIVDKALRADFFCQCEKLGIKGWKFFTVYKYCCDQNSLKFIQCVLKSEKIMFETIKQYEEKQK